MWYVAFREDALDEAGKIVRVRRNVRIGSAKELSKREARRIADEDILNRTNAQAQQPASLVTLKYYVETRFKPDHVWALKHAGKLHYEYILDKHVLPALGDIRLRDMTLDHVQALVRLKIESGLSIQTARHIRNVISAIFTHAKKRRVFHGDNPAEGVTMPEMVRKERHSLTFEQAKALLEALPTPAKEMALVAITTSLNVAEMLALRWKWVNLSDELHRRCRRGPASQNPRGARKLFTGANSDRLKRNPESATSRCRPASFQRWRRSVVHSAMGLPATSCSARPSGRRWMKTI